MCQSSAPYTLDRAFTLTPGLWILILNTSQTKLRRKIIFVQCLITCSITSISSPVHAQLCVSKSSVDLTDCILSKSDSLSFKGGLDIKNSHDPPRNRSGYVRDPGEMSWYLRSCTGFRKTFWDRAGPKESEQKDVRCPGSVLSRMKPCWVITLSQSDTPLCCKCQN